MRNLLIGIFALFWCGLVFLVTFWLTFPSDAVVERVRWEAPKRLGKEYSVDLAGVSPWWVGFSAQDVKVYHTPQSWRSEEPGDTSLVGMAKDVRLRVSPLSLLRRNPYVSGSLTLLEGTVDYAIGVSAGKGDVELSELSVSSAELPLADLMVLMPEGVEMSATGNVEVDIDLEGGENGMADGNGAIKIGGANILLSDLVHPEMGPLGFDVPISELVLVAEVRDGKATVQRGLVDSELLKVDIKGDITLREPIDRSSLDLQVVITDVSPKVGMLEMALAPGKQDDGYHFTMRGMLGRARFEPARGSSRGSMSRDRSRPVPSTRPPQTLDRTETDEEREKRRAEIRARLEARRAEREGRRADPEPPVEEDEEVFEDDPVFEEELPPEGEEEFFDEPLDEEDFEDFE